MRTWINAFAAHFASMPYSYLAVNPLHGLRNRLARCRIDADLEVEITDTGPDVDSLRDVYLWDMVEERKVMLGRFLSPEPFRGEIRCDPHLVPVETVARPTFMPVAATGVTSKAIIWPLSAAIRV